RSLAAGRSGLVLQVLLQRHDHLDEATPYLFEEGDNLVEIGIIGQLQPRRLLLGGGRFRPDSAGKRQIARDELFLERDALALQTRDFGLQRRARVRFGLTSPPYRTRHGASRSGPSEEDYHHRSRRRNRNTRMRRTSEGESSPRTEPIKTSLSC